MQLVVLGYAFGGNVKHLKLAIVDQDHGVPAVKVRELASPPPSGSRVRSTRSTTPTRGKRLTDLRNGRVNGVLTIPPEFSRRVLQKNQPRVALIEDASIDAFASGGTVREGVAAILDWIVEHGRTPGATILAEAMVKGTRDPEFRSWSRNAARRFRALILERLEQGRDAGEIDAALDLEATALLLAAALDGLLFHHLVDPKLAVTRAAEPIAAMLRDSEGERSAPS